MYIFLRKSWRGEWCKLLVFRLLWRHNLTRCHDVTKETKTFQDFILEPKVGNFLSRQKLSISQRIYSLAGHPCVRQVSQTICINFFLSWIYFLCIEEHLHQKDSEQRRNIGWQYSTSVEFCQPLQRIESVYHCVFQSLQDFITILHLCALRIIRDKIYLRQ